MDWHFDIDHFVFFLTLRRLLNVTPMASKKMRANHFRWTHPLISKLFPSVYFCWTTKSNAEDSSKNHSDRACFVIYCMRMNLLRFKVLRCLRLHIGGHYIARCLCTAPKWCNQHPWLTCYILLKDVEHCEAKVKWTEFFLNYPFEFDTNGTRVRSNGRFFYKISQNVYNP